MLAGGQKDALNAVKIAPAVEGQRGLSPDPSDSRNPPGADEKAAALPPVLEAGPAELSVRTGSVISRSRGWRRRACGLSLNRVAPRVRNTCPRNSLSCLLPYFEALRYPKSAKTCKVPAGLECCVTNNAQQYSFTEGTSAFL